MEDREAMRAKLQEECATRNLDINSGAGAILQARVWAVSDGKLKEFPDEEWSVQNGTLLKFGVQGIAEVSTCADAGGVITSVRELWDAMLDWPEVERLLRAKEEIPKVKLISTFT